MQARSITNALRARALPVELVKGEGYCYFIFDNGLFYDSFSVMVPRLSDLDRSTWIREGTDFALRILRDRAELGGVAELDALAMAVPMNDAGRFEVERPFTSADAIRVERRPGHCPELTYFHNGVRIERDRAVELIGERA